LRNGFCPFQVFPKEHWEIVTRKQVKAFAFLSFTCQKKETKSVANNIAPLKNPRNKSEKSMQFIFPYLKQVLS